MKRLVHSGSHMLAFLSVQEQQSEEAKLLASLTGSLTEADKTRILNEGIELEKKQGMSHVCAKVGRRCTRSLIAVQNVDVLPMLQISDIEKTKKFETFERKALKNKANGHASNVLHLNRQVRPPLL